MILRSLAITDFRQFRGTHRIKFAMPGRSGKKNVTVIHGPGGSGKTGIVRAIWFAFSGMMQLPHERSDVSDQPVSLINGQAIRPGSGQAEATVELVFQHQQLLFTVRRGLIGRRQAETVVEEPVPAMLRIERPGLPEIVMDGPGDVAEAISREVGHLAPHILFHAGQGPSASHSLGQALVTRVEQALDQLQTLAGGTDFPLITDGILDEIDEPSSRYLIETVPQRCGQWVSLHRRPADMHSLRSASHLGQTYRINLGKEGSRIEERACGERGVYGEDL